MHYFLWQYYGNLPIAETHILEYDKQCKRVALHPFNWGIYCARPLIIIYQLVSFSLNKEFKSFLFKKRS